MSTYIPRGARSYQSGAMPGTNRTFEEFESFLCSFYLTLQELFESPYSEDHTDAKEATEILEGFAKRYGLQTLEEAHQFPRITEIGWAPAAFASCGVIVARLTFFRRVFKVARDEATPDHQEFRAFKRIVLNILLRHGAIYAVRPSLLAGDSYADSFDKDDERIGLKLLDLIRK